MHLITYFTTLFLALVASAQSQYAINGFRYDGCVQIDPSHFEYSSPHPAGGRTPEDCEEICRGWAYVAVFEDACRCGNNPGEINHQNDAVCNNPCKGDLSLGWCGSSSPTCTQYANLYCYGNGESLATTYPYTHTTTEPWNSYTYTTTPTASYTDSCFSPGYGNGTGCNGCGNGYSGTSTLTYTSDGTVYTYQPTQLTLTTVTTTLGTYTFESWTSSTAETWTTTLSGESAAYTTVTWTSRSETVIPSTYTSTAEATYVTETPLSNAGTRERVGVFGGLAMAVVMGL